MGKIEDKDVSFTVDTGATIPLLNFKPKRQLSTDRALIQGVMGKKKKEQLLSQPALLWPGVCGGFVIAEEASMCLLG